MYYVYIMTNRSYGTLYIGVTSNIRKRVTEHKEKKYEGFTKEYSLTKLVWFEIFSDPLEAIKREKSMKEWKRDWKIKLICAKNPEWVDLYHLLP